VEADRAVVVPAVSKGPKPTAGSRAAPVGPRSGNGTDGEKSNGGKEEHRRSVRASRIVEPATRRCSGKLPTNPCISPWRFRSARSTGQSRNGVGVRASTVAASVPQAGRRCIVRCSKRPKSPYRPMADSTYTDKGFSTLPLLPPTDIYSIQYPNLDIGAKQSRFRSHHLWT